jgi:hypothetical protein
MNFQPENLTLYYRKIHFGEELHFLLKKRIHL